MIGLVLALGQALFMFFGALLTVVQAALPVLMGILVPAWGMFVQALFHGLGMISPYLAIFAQALVNNLGMVVHGFWLLAKNLSLVLIASAKLGQAFGVLIMDLRVIIPAGMLILASGTILHMFNLYQMF